MNVASEQSVTRGWKSARKVLAIRLDNLGDVLMTSPALAAIRATLPRARITLLTSPSGALVAPHLGVVDETLVYAAPWVKGTSTRQVGDQELGQPELDLVSKLARMRFDAAIIFTVCTQSALPAALFCRLAGIRRRLAYSRENPYDLLTDWLPDPDTLRDGMRHEVRRQLALVEYVGFRTADERLRYRVDARHVGELNSLVQTQGISLEHPYFVVHPGASASSRRYPAYAFGDAAERICERSGYLAIFTGSAEEEPLVEAARARMRARSVSLAGRLSLPQLAALIDGAGVLVTNNTGPAHLAAALETPVVDLYALTNPQHTPWRVPAVVLNHPVPCRHCVKSQCPEGHHDCLRKVDPETVAWGALTLLGDDAGRLRADAARPRAVTTPTATVEAGNAA